MEPSSEPIPPPLDPVAESPTPTPWGFWATIGWAFIIGLGYVTAQTVAVIVFLLLGGVPGGIDWKNMEAVASNGKVVAIATLVSAPITVLLCVLAAWVKKGLSARDYFALRWPPAKTVGKWFLFFVIYLIVVDVCLSVIEDKKTAQFMKDVLGSMEGWMPQLWVALFVAAPLSEEFFFRGFLFAGLKNSRLGGYGAVVVTSLLFAGIHFQYDIQGLLFVLLVGVFFGVTRLNTDSLWLCIALHSFMNIMATIPIPYLSE